jgi:hypothetical protein
MLKYEYINKEWIVSSAARRVYRTAACASLVLYPILIIAIMGMVPEILHPALRILLFASVVAAAITLVGMEFFLFRFDDSPALKQIFWFCAMGFVPLGPALYCFVVYSGSKALEGVRVDVAENVSAKL